MKMFFKKKEVKNPTKPEKRKEINDLAIVNKANYTDVFFQSVQKRASDFMSNQLNINGPLVNIAQDSSLSDSSVKNIENVYTPNIVGKEIIYNYFANQSFIGFQNCALLSQNWLINKCCMQPPLDAAAIGYDITLKDDETTEEDNEILAKIKDISNFTKDYNIIDICREYAEKKRRFGQILCVPLVDDVDYSLPFNIDSVDLGSYRGMTIIEPQWIAPILDQDATANPLSKRFYQPTYFRMPNGSIIHYSWVFFGTYGNIPDILKPTYYFGGYPLPQLLYEQVYAAEKTAKEVPMLAQSKRLNYVEGNLNSYVTDEERLNKEIKIMSWLRNNWGWLLVKKDQKLGQLDTSLADFDSVVMLSYQIVAAIAGMPSARLLETSPKGWQSTGSYEDENYKKLLLSIQNLDFLPILNRHYQLLTKSLYGKNYEYNCVFKPIDSPSEKERAEINEIISRTNTTYVNAGVVSPEEIRNVLREDENSGYNVLSEEMEGEPIGTGEEDLLGSLGGSETPQSPFSAQDDWEEEDHPRKDNGQFGKGGGSNKVNELLGKEYTGVKGQEAVNLLMKEKQGHVKGAFHRNDIGDIDLIWGNESMGLAHIIKRRKETKQPLGKLLSSLSDVVEKGDISQQDNGRFKLSYKGKIAIIEPKLLGNKVKFVFTAFYDR